MCTYTYKYTYVILQDFNHWLPLVKKMYTYINFTIKRKMRLKFTTNSKLLQ
jgi:hypothetical protein